MLENTPEKAAVTASKKLTINNHDDNKEQLEQDSIDNHLTEANGIEVTSLVKQKENLSDGVKVHNFSECCRMWMCSHCSKSFASSRALKIHEVKQHENATRHFLKCGTCHEEFEHANLLHIHMRVHHNVKVCCPRCKDSFEHPNVLKLHYKTHHSEPVCVACGLKFDHDKLLRLHLEHYHKIGNKGAKGATASSGRKSKVTAEEKTAGGAAVEQENVDGEAPEKMCQMKEDEGREEANGVVPSQWDCDEDAMSRDSSDSRDTCSSDVEAGDMDKRTELGSREAESPMTQEKQDETESHGNQQGQHQCTESPLRFQGETESVLSNAESVSRNRDVKKETSVSPGAVECQIPIQPQRSSVIVTTGSISPPFTYSNPQENWKRRRGVEEDREGTQETRKFALIVTDWDACSKGSPQSPAASYAGSPASTVSGDESGDSESTSPRAHPSKRATLRCNRCQEEFLSKMEYLHHLISHQKGDNLNKTQNDLSPESKAFQKLKSSLRIKMEARGEDRLTEEENNELDHDVQKRESFGKGGTFSDAQASCSSPPVYKQELTPNLTVPCTLCSERFGDWRELKAHVGSRHKRPHCSECGLQFDHKNLLKIHMNSYHSSLDVLQCYQCGKSFDNRSEFVSHVTSHETSLRNTKNTQKEHKPLRRMASAPVPGEHLSRFRSQGPVLLARDRDGNGNSLGDTGEFEKRGDQVLDAAKSRIGNFRPYADRLFPKYGAFRHHKQETITSKEQDEWYRKVKANFLTGPESRTRIFLPKFHEDVEHDHEHVSVKRRSQDEREALLPGNTKRDSDAEKMACLEDATVRFSAFSAYERTSRPILSKAKRDRDGLPLVGPPPLIPVVRPEKSHSFTEKSDAGLLRVHRPVTRTASANSALSYPRVLPFPTIQRPNWPPEPIAPSSPVRDGPWDPQEFPTRESINNITKEALLHSLSLRRRASAPELGALVTPLAQPQRLAAPESAAIKKRLGNSPKRSENAESSLTATPGRFHQLNEGYQPRRKHPRDFTCHHCGIYFGHKKLLKIHLDCYHGSAQELQCLRCQKNFSSRSEFLEHLMSHEGGDELLAIQRKRLRLDRRSSLPQGGETVIRHELNTSVAKETTLTRESSRLDEPKRAVILGELQKPLLKELKPRTTEGTVGYLKPNDPDLKQEGRVNSSRLDNEKSESDDGANFCFVCGQSFTSGKQLEHHISSHAVVDNDGRYCCSLCHKSFDHHRKLEIHTRSHTGFKPHKCELCGRSFPYYSSYYYHKMTHTEDRPHKCEVCGKGFIQARYLRSHMKTHKEQNGWASDEELNVDTLPEQVTITDGASTTTNSLFSQTEAKIETEAIYQDGHSAHGELEEHDTARILCSFKQSSNVGMRKQSPSKVAQSESEMCDDFASGAALHREDSPSVNQTVQANIKADEHGQAKGIQGLSEVATVELNIKKENSQDTNNESLKKTKKKKYKCKHCEKNFSSYSSLHVHVRIHTGHRPYSCNHCFKKFTHSSGLKRHVRCHTGEKPYPCPACPSAFADRGALKSHIRTHTGERPFVCDFCNKSFTQPSSLRVHKKTVHAHEFFDDK